MMCTHDVREFHVVLSWTEVDVLGLSIQLRYAVQESQTILKNLKRISASDLNNKLNNVNET